MANPMRTGFDGLYLLHFYESCRLLSYPDPASELFKALRRAGLDPYNLKSVPLNFAHLSGDPWTLGWVTCGPDVGPCMAITQTDADIRFARRLELEFEPGVQAAITSGATQKQYDSLVCFAYNLGVGALRKSTLLRLHNARDYNGAAEEFWRWTKAGRVVMKGLQRSRAAERYVYKGMDAQWAGHAAEEHLA